LTTSPTKTKNTLYYIKFDNIPNKNKKHTIAILYKYESYSNEMGENLHYFAGEVTKTKNTLYYINMRAILMK
jgi:hypothetical protein